MLHQSLWILLALIGLGSLSGQTRGEAPPSAESNQPITQLGLTSVEGKTLAWALPAEAKGTVILFLSLDCPISNQALGTLAEIHKKYQDHGIVLQGVLITEDTSEELRTRLAKMAIPFSIGVDREYQAARKLGASTTPEAFVLDGHGKVRYRGRINDAYGARLKKNRAITREDLQCALDDLLAGRAVEVEKTTPVGCPIVLDAPDAAPDAKVSYYSHIEPILRQHCQSCHQPGQAGPFSLLTYKQARSWSGDIKEYTQSRAMPPWKPTGGPAYLNERIMPEKDIALLAAWVDAGCPEGIIPTDRKPVIKTDSHEWALGKPDLIVEAGADYHVGPTGDDLFRCFVVPTGLQEEKHIIAYEVKPGNASVLHHTLLYYDTTGKGRELEAREAKRPVKPDAVDRGPGYPVAMGIGFVPNPDQFKPGQAPPVGGFGGWAPGQLPTQLPPGTGFVLPSGSDFIIQCHYHRTGRQESDRTRIGLYFSKKPVEKVFQTLTIGGMSPLTVIPAGKPDYVAKGSRWLMNDALLYSVLPHMHLLGKSVKVTLTTPEGNTETLIDIKDWDYNWQETYWFKKPILAKAGSRIDIEARYDNSAGNPNNPNSPPRMVFFGEQTTNEMLFAFIGATPVGEGRIRTSREAVPAAK